MSELTKPALSYESNSRIIRFGGHRWNVKTGVNLAPAHNNWTDDPRSIWIGTDGKLHLKIRQQDGIWYSSQIISMDFARYGLYRFYVQTPVQTLDENVVLGLFLYSDDQHEIDIEFKQEPGSDSNTQYVIQPHTVSGNRYTFPVDTGGPTIHEIDWQRDYINFRTLAGDDPATAKVLQEWRFDGPGVPNEDKQLRLELNLWLLDPKSQAGPVEVVVSDLETLYCPLLTLGSNQAGF